MVGLFLVELGNYPNLNRRMAATAVSQRNHSGLSITDTKTPAYAASFFSTSADLGKRILFSK